MKYKLALGTLLMLLLANALTTTFNVTLFRATLTQLAPENGGIMVSANINGPFFQKGMEYSSWLPNFGSANSNESLRLLSLTNTDWVALCVYWYQQNITSDDIHPAFNTPSNSSVIQAINRSHELGMKVMLKPMVDLLDGDWRGLIPPSTEWFASYTNFMNSWAEFSQEHELDMLCVGCEFNSNDGQTANWENVTAAVRQRYSGPITYAANWDDYQNVHWWDSVDYVGIDAYFSLTNKTNPTVEELKAGWSPWVNAMASWQATVNKPIVFPEIGYRSADGANEAPWDYLRPAPVDLQEQIDCYNATFQMFSNKSWFYGFYWHNWETSAYAGGNRDADYTPQNKPVQSLITSWYASAGTPMVSVVFQNSASSSLYEYKINETFRVNITVNSPDIAIWSWQVGIYFNSSILECTSLGNGTFFDGRYTLGFQPGIIHNDLGYVTISNDSLRLPEIGVTGPGVLMWFEFHIKKHGNCLLNLMFSPPDLICGTKLNEKNGSNVVPISPITLTEGILAVPKMGDLGSGFPPQFFQFDGSCGSDDVPLFIQCYRRTAPAEAMYLGDLGSSSPYQPYYEFYNYDVKVTSADVQMFILCYRAQGH